MALGALAISPGMTPLSMGGQKVSETNPLPITIVPGKRDLKGDDSGDALIKAVVDQTLADIGLRLLEAITGRSEQGGDQAKPKSASQKAVERDEKIGKSDTKDGPTFKGDIKNMVDSVKEGFGDINSTGFGKMFLPLPSSESVSDFPIFSSLSFAFCDGDFGFG